MRGIPSAFLIGFLIFLGLIELISWLGFRILINQTPKKTKNFLTVIYLLVSLSITSLISYSFSNPEIIRQSRDYTFFLFVISLSFLNILPKTFFSLSTLLSFIFRLIKGKLVQRLILSGSFLISTSFFCVVIYGIFVGRFDIHVEKQDLYFTNLPEQLNGFKIVQLSDIHLGSFGKDTKVLEETVKVIDELQPDLLLFTGDIVNNFGDEMKDFEPYLQMLSAKYGKYAIQGNHDYGDYYNWPDTISKRQNLNQIKSGLTDTGFKLLLNQSILIQVKDTSISLIGVENWGHKPFPQYANLDLAMKGIPEKSFKILMSHDPAHWKSIVIPQTDIPLTLSGHTHGGQIGINWLELNLVQYLLYKRIGEDYTNQTINGYM